jgi:polyisoprenoid-binding protein YceI
MKTDRLLLGILGIVVCAWQYPAAARAQSPVYQVDPQGSRIYVRVDKATRLGHSHGIEGRLSSGQVNFGGEGGLEFDMKSFAADSPQARQYVGLEPAFSQSDAAKVNANMKGPECLDVARYPKALCQITTATPQDGQAAGTPGEYQVQGQFTLHGTTKPIQFTATLSHTAEAGVLSLRGNFRITQSSYGIQPYSALGGLIRIADELTIYGDLMLRSGPKP